MLNGFENELWKEPGEESEFGLAVASFAWNLLFKIKYDTLQYIQNVNYSKSLRFAITECKSCSAFYETAFFGMVHLSLIVKNNFQIKALNQGAYARKGRWAEAGL